MDIQVPTPPSSESGDDPPDAIISISTAFHPDADLYKIPPDLILLTCDAVLFYVHSEKLLDASFNVFKAHLPIRNDSLVDAPSDTRPIIALPESSLVLNTVLHIIYSMSCIHFPHSLDCIVQAIASLKSYGVSLKAYTTPDSPLYDLVLSRAPLHPIELYAVASESDLYELAVAISPHLLTYDLSNLTDGLALKIGPTYLKRLFFLHLGRKAALKRLLRTPPSLHGPTADCEFSQQRNLTSAWTLAAAYLAWDARPDLSTSAIQADLGPLGDDLTCNLCKQALELRIKQLVVEWSNIKVISHLSTELPASSTDSLFLS